MEGVIYAEDYLTDLKLDDMLQPEASNIFQTRNDWGLIAIKARQVKAYIPKFKQIADIIEFEVGLNPLTKTTYQGGIQTKVRQIYAEMMCRYSLWTYSDMSLLIKKDHSTVNHCRKVIQNYLDTDKRFREVFERIENKVKLLK